ncbi:uncharacterized protein LOC101860942 [Aplysia californica]|uniref:Uncharacterized protein LOC101860942 n=1 Tax=Aplysia californica TaxID=6500 RepID=A0ABM1AE93_APLCA|nr:uncharacterized protein LOC101860942 [Aplysia californica]
MTDIKVRFSVEYGVPAQPTTTTTTTTTMAPLTTSSGSPTLPKLVPEEIMYPDFGWPRRLPDDELELTLNEPVKQAPVTGWIPITFRVPDDAKWFRIRATCEYPYKEVEESMFVSKSNSPTDSYLQLSVPTDRPKVGDVLRVKANSTTPVSELFYQVYTKGKMVIANSLKPDSPRKDLEFSVTLEQRMAPSVRIVVFYLREDNSEFVVDALSLNVDGIFQKPVSVQFSKDTVKPGEDVDVILQAEADSLVFLLSNDKSVQLLRSGNDITQDVVSGEWAGLSGKG